MATKKSQLVQRDRYAFLKSAELATRIIASIESNRPGAQRITVEALDQFEWDDVLLVGVAETGHRWAENWQVKRQSTAVEWQALSELLRLGKRLLDADAASAPAPQRTFQFGIRDLVDVHLRSRRYVPIRFLRDLCDSARVATDAGRFLASLSKEQRELLNATEQALTASTADAMRVLGAFHVAVLGDEAAVRQAALDRLGRFYSNREDVFDALVEMLAGATGAAEYDYSHFSKRVLVPKGKRHAESPAWVHVAATPMRDEWTRRGPLAEQSLIDTLWTPPAEGGRVLHLAAHPADGAQAVAALCRAVLHRHPAITVEVGNPERWVLEQHTASLGTTGLSQPDNAHSSLRPLRRLASDAPAIVQNAAQFADGLTKEMDDAVWADIRGSLAQALASQGASMALRWSAELSAAMIAIWRRWEAHFEADPRLRNGFLAQMLATRAETLVSGGALSVRVGRTTLDLLRNGIVVALAVAAALDSSGQTVVPLDSDGANLEVGLLPTHLIALEVVCDARRHPVRIGFGCDTFFHRERARIILLSGTETPGARIRDTVTELDAQMHVGPSEQHGLQRSRSEMVVITLEFDLLKAMEGGPAAVNAWLNDQIQSRLRAESDLLGTVIDPAIKVFEESTR